MYLCDCSVCACVRIPVFVSAMSVCACREFPRVACVLCVCVVCDYSISCINVLVLSVYIMCI